MICARRAVVAGLATLGPAAASPPREGPRHASTRGGSRARAAAARSTVPSSAPTTRSPESDGERDERIRLAALNDRTETPMRHTSMAILLLVTAAAAGELAPTRPARLDAWRIIGPGGGGTMRRPAVSPDDPKVVVLGCDMTGAYLTSDGGASWRMLNLGSVPTAFAFDPSRPETIYAGAEAVYRSDDSGRTWRMVLPDSAKNTVARAIGDHGDRVFFTEDPAYPGSGRNVTVHAIAVDEDDPGRVFVAASAADSPVPGTPESPTLLLGSTDGGRTWARLTELGTERVFALRASGGEETPRVHAVGETASTRAQARPGGTIRPRAEPASPPASSGATPLGGGVRLCDAALTRPAGAAGAPAGDSDAGARSSEASRFPRTAAGTSRAANGSLWRPCGEVALRRRVGRRERIEAFPRAHRGLGPLPARGVRGTAGDPPRGPRRRTVERHCEDRGRGKDVGRRARGVGQALGEPRPGPGSGAGGGGRPLGLVRLSVRPRRGAERPRRRVRDRPLPHLPHHRRRRGLDAGQLRAARRGPVDDTRPRRDDHVRDPVRPARREAASSSPTPTSASSAARTGRDVDELHDGIPQRWRNTTYWLAFDPDVKDVVLGRLQRHTRPAAPQDVAPHGPGTLQGRCRRLDRRGPALDPLEHRHRGIGHHPRPARPEEPEGNRTLYAAAFGRGVYKSTDNGRTWTLRNAGLAAVRAASRSPGGSPSSRTARSTSWSRAAASGEGSGSRRRCALPLHRRGRELAAGAAAGRDERAERPHRRPGGPEAPVPVGLGRNPPGRRHRRRHLPEHRRRRDLASRPRRMPSTSTT